MKNTNNDEDGSRTILIAVLVTLIVIAAFLLPSAPTEVPVIEEPMPTVEFINHAEASEPRIVLIATTTDHIVGKDEMVVDKAVDSEYEELADAIIDCESSGRNVEIIDTNGEWSRGIAQFQDKTWDWLSDLAGVTGSSTEPEKARKVLIWSLENGYGSHWTCYRKLVWYEN